MLKNNNTRYLIRQSFVNLLAEGPYEKISVLDIAKRTGVSRQTFYVNFSSKEELALSFLEDIFYGFFDVVEPGLDKNTNLFIFKTLYRVHKDNADKWAVVMSCNIDSAVSERYSSYVRRFLGNIIRKIETKFSYTFYVDALIAHFSGSCLNLMKLWMEQNMPVSEEQMARATLLMLHRNIPALIQDMQELSNNP